MQDKKIECEETLKEFLNSSLGGNLFSKMFDITHNENWDEDPDYIDYEVTLTEKDKETNVLNFCVRVYCMDAEKKNVSGQIQFHVGEDCIDIPDNDNFASFYAWLFLTSFIQGPEG